MRCPLATCFLAPAWLAACASVPLPLALPPLPPTVQHAALAAPEVTSSGSPQTLHIEVLALRDAPAGPAVDLAAAAIARTDDAPFRGASSLPIGARWLTGADLANWLQARHALGPDRLQSLAAADTVVLPDLATQILVPGTRLPAVRLVRAASDAPALALVQLLPTVDGGNRETIHIADGLPTTGAALLFVPAAASRHVAGHALLLTATSTPVTDEAIAAARAGAEPTSAPPAPWPAPWREAFAAVGPHARRPALLALTQPLHLARATDVLLIADDRALIDITAALREVDPTTAELAWSFERALWQALLPRLERDELTPALAAACWRHLGTAADDPGLLRLVLATAADADAFDAALREENLAALAARDAAQRVRGHDWLAAHGGSVAGYAPLDPPAARRQALRQHARASAAAAVGR